MHYSSTALEPDYRPKTKNQALAVEIAKALEDTRNFACYVQLSQLFQEDYLRRVLAFVMSLPDERISKSRAALFVHMVRKLKRV